jgi:diguanylate cyclase (GGDEF)-like protein
MFFSQAIFKPADLLLPLILSTAVFILALHLPEQEWPPSPYIAQMEILDQEAPAAEVLSGQYESSFRPVDGQRLPIADGRAQWARIEMTGPWTDKNDLPHLVLWNLAATGATAYINGELIGTAKLSGSTGAGRYDNRNGHFDLPNGSFNEIYLHFAAGRQERAVPQVLGREADDYQSFGHLLLMNSFLTLTLFMGAVSFGVYVILRQTAFLAYAAVAMSSLIAFALLSGELPYYGIEVDGTIAVFFSTGSLFALAISSLFLIQEILANNPVMRRARNILNGIYTLAAIFALLTLIESHYPFGVPWAESVFVIKLFSLWSIMGVVVAILIAAVRQGSKPAIPLLVSVVVNWLSITVEIALRSRGEMLLLVEAIRPMMIPFSLAMPALSMASSVLRQRRNLVAARAAAETDGLTGILNRGALEVRLATAFHDARGNHADLAVLFIDLDHFKKLNDTHGHAAGDACLRGIVGPIRKQLRGTDHLGRWGGEEFLVVLPGAGAKMAVAIAERIRRTLADLAIEIDDSIIRLTASIGVSAIAPNHGEYNQITAAADRALYAAKRDGRNRVVLIA